MIKPLKKPLTRRQQKIQDFNQLTERERTILIQTWACLMVQAHQFDESLPIEATVGEMGNIRRQLSPQLERLVKKLEADMKKHGMFHELHEMAAPFGVFMESFVRDRAATTNLLDKLREQLASQPQGGHVGIVQQDVTAAQVEAMHLTWLIAKAQLEWQDACASNDMRKAELALRRAEKYQQQLKEVENAAA